MTRFYTLTIVACLFGIIYGQTPSCQWTNNGNSYDLSGLTNNAVDYKIAYAPPDAKKNVWLNICRPLINTLCGTGLAGCQQWDPNNSGGKASIGATASQSFAYGTQYSGSTGLMLKYGGGALANNIPRSMEIDFICSPGSGIGTPSYVTEVSSSATYIFTWTTQYACSTNGGTTGGTTGGLSGGSIFLIIFFVAIFVYFAAGVGYMKFRKQATGVELIPNVDFWASIPGLCKDGVKFLISKVRGGGGSAYSNVK